MNGLIPSLLAAVMTEDIFRPLNLARGTIDIHCEYSLRTVFVCSTSFSIPAGQTEMRMFFSFECAFVRDSVDQVCLSNGS